MKAYTNICVFFGMLLFSSIAQGQITYKTYMQPKSPYQIDTVFNPASKGFTGIGQKNHLWLAALNSQYVDTTKNKINAFAIPAFQPVQKNSLLNPGSTVNQVISTMLPYGYYFPAPATYTPGAYTPPSRLYQGLPYGYSPYTTRTIGAPYYNYILPKF